MINNKMRGSGSEFQTLKSTESGPLLPELEPRPDLRQLNVLSSLGLLVRVVAKGHKVLVVCKRDHPPAQTRSKIKKNYLKEQS